MYGNPMQQQPQRPPTMMNAPPMPPQNPGVGVPQMRPMVAPSPMQVSMLQQQQSPQAQMMVRPGAGSPYAMINRAALYDKSKRPGYPTDPRQPPMMQPGQQPPMGYGNVMPPNPAMMPNAVVASGPSPIRPQ